MRANNLKSVSATNISPVISVLMSCKKVLTGKTSITSLFWDEFSLQVSTSADSQVARPSLACHFSEGVRSFLGCHTAQSLSSSRSPLGWSRCARTRYSRISRDRKQHSLIKAREFCFICQQQQPCDLKLLWIIARVHFVKTVVLVASLA